MRDDARSLENLAERIAALEAKVATCPGVAKDLRVIEIQIARVEERLATLAAQRSRRSQAVARLTEN
jgi:hypothetical protein